MRYLVGFVFVLALTTSPPSVAAQSSDETSPHAAAPFTLEYQPAVQPYEEARGRVLQSRNGLIGSSVVVGLGAALIGGGVALQRNLNQRPPPPGTMLDFSGDFGGIALASVGGVIAIAGLVGMTVSGVNWDKRKRELRRLEEAGHRGSHRVHWDAEASRLVF